MSSLDDNTTTSEKQCGFSHLVRYRRISRSRKSHRTMLLFKAVKYRKKVLVQQLIKRGVRINAVIRQPHVEDCFYSFLMVNAIYGNREITRMLIRAGCWLNITTCGDCTALHYAVEFHNRGIAAELIAAGADVNLKTVKGITALHVAIAGTSQIDRKAKEIADNRGNHPIRFLKDAKEFEGSLTLARISGIVKKMFESGQERRVCLYLVEMMLKAGADVNPKDMYGCTPLHYAACAASPELVKILMEAGADINAKNIVGVSALHAAVLFCDEITTRLLLSSGASVAIKTTEGHTALHWAVSLNDKFDSQATIIRNLMEYGSDVNARSRYNEPVISMAFGSTRNLILQYVAEIEARTQKKIFDRHSEHSLHIGYMYDTYMKILGELKAMRNGKIGTTIVNFFTLLTEPVEVVSLLARNEEFLREFEESDYKSTFPSFAPRLREKITAATKCNEKSVKWQCNVDFSCNI